MDGLTFEPKDDRNIYLPWKGWSCDNCPCEGSAQEVAAVPHRAQWVLLCCREWLLPGLVAQLSPSCFHSIISACGWLRWVPLRQKVETVSKGTRQTALPLLSWCYSQL